MMKIINDGVYHRIYSATCDKVGDRIPYEEIDRRLYAIVRLNVRGRVWDNIRTVVCSEALGRINR